MGTSTGRSDRNFPNGGRPVYPVLNTRSPQHRYSTIASALQSCINLWSKKARNVMCLNCTKSFYRAFFAHRRSWMRRYVDVPYGLPFWLLTQYHGRMPALRLRRPVRCTWNSVVFYRSGTRLFMLKCISIGLRLSTKPRMSCHGTDVSARNSLTSASLRTATLTSNALSVWGTSSQPRNWQKSHVFYRHFLSQHP